MSQNKFDVVVRIASITEPTGRHIHKTCGYSMDTLDVDVKTLGLSSQYKIPEIFIATSLRYLEGSRMTDRTR
jgi:hypothetical protein